MVVLGVKNEQELAEWERRLADEGTRFATFIEPDRNNERTALAIMPTENGERFGRLRLL